MWLFLLQISCYIRQVATVESSWYSCDSVCCLFMFTVVQELLNGKVGRW